jgi:hypothetical protein
VKILGNGGLGGTDIVADWTPRAQSGHSGPGKPPGAMTADQISRNCIQCSLSTDPYQPRKFYPGPPEEERTDSLPLQLALFALFWMPSQQLYLQQTMLVGSTGGEENDGEAMGRRGYILWCDGWFWREG